MSHYFPPYRSSGRNIKVELDLSSYATKSDLKDVTHVDVSSFASKTNLANLKAEVNKTDVDKLKTVPVDLAKLSNVVKNDVVKKTEYDRLVPKVDNIDTTQFVSRTKYEIDGSDLEKKISDVNEKIPDVSGSVITIITGLATNSALTAIENKIPDISSLVKKTDFDAKLKKIMTELLQINLNICLLKMHWKN